MTRVLLVLGIVSLLFSACVPNKKYVYLQKNDVNRKDLPKDTVVRTYSQPEFQYRIQPNDALYVRFESLTPEEYNFFEEGANAASAGGGNRNFTITSELVDPDGTITFPVIGKFKVTGLTVFQIQDSLQAVASRYLEEAVVKVRLVNFRFTILGEVNQEGTVNSFNNRITLPEALGLAGGAGELADRANVKIIRLQGNQTIVGYVNLLDEDLLNSPFYYVHQNDVLVVPALRQRPFRRYFGQNFGLVVSSISLVLLVANLIK